MNRIKNTDLKALRALDPAPKADLSLEQQIRADARLQQILDSTPHQHFAGGRSVHKRRFRPIRHVVAPVLLAAVVAVTGTLTLLPGPDSNDAANASWSSVPGTMSSADKEVADAACRDRGIVMDSPQLAVSERRGKWVVMLYSNRDQQAGACLAYLPVGAKKAEDIAVGEGQGGFGTQPAAAEFTREAIFEFQQRGSFGLRDRPTVFFTHGNVGSDVTAVTLTSSEGKPVRATVLNGTYVAWWPGIPSGDPTGDASAPDAGISYNITLKNQTEINDAKPKLSR